MATRNVRMRLDGTIPAVDLPLDEHVRVVVHPPGIHVLEVTCLAFAEDREVLLPDVEQHAEADPGPARTPPLEVLAAAAIFLDQHREKSVLVVGHTDTVGQEKDNEVLSLDRARSVSMYLRGDTEGWATHAKKHAQVEDLQRALSWVDGEFTDFSCSPGAVDGESGPVTMRALSAFREGVEGRFGHSLGTEPEADEGDWEAFFQLYDLAICGLCRDEQILTRVRSLLRFTQPDAIGLGERHPTERPDQDDLDSERNRRVELLFLDAEEAEMITDIRTCEAYLYSESQALERTWLSAGFPSREDEVHVRVCLEDGQPVPGQECVLEEPGGEMRVSVTNSEGVASFRGVKSGTCELRLEDRDALDWGAEFDGPRTLPPPPEGGEEDEEDDVLPYDTVQLTPAQRRVLDLYDED